MNLAKYIGFFIKTCILTFLIIMILSVFFMFLFSIIPLKYEILHIFNTLSIFLSFGGGAFYFTKSLLQKMRYFGPFTLLNGLLLLNICFALVLAALATLWGSLLWGILMGKIIISALGSLSGAILGQKLYKPY